MKFVVRWSFFVSGDVSELGAYESFGQADTEAMDIRYTGIASWVDVVADPGKTPTSLPMSEETAMHWRMSKWWTHVDPRTAVLAQLIQPKVCMPVEDFRSMLAEVLGGEVVPPEAHPNQIEERIMRGKWPPQIAEAMNGT